MGMYKFLTVALCALVLSTATTATTTDGTAYSSAITRPANSTRISPLATLVRQCTVHRGVDFIGSDIANLPGTERDCCQYCTNLESCDQYTWTDYNGGTCWLKKSTLDYVLKPGAVSGIILNGDPASSMYYSIIDVDSDMPTNDVRNEKVVGNYTACAEKCHKENKCNAFSFTPADSMCYLKSAGSPLVEKVGVFTAIVFKPLF